MFCPECKEELFCHCKSCIDRNHEKIPYLWKKYYQNGETYKLQYCGNCGYENIPDFWEDLEYNQLMEAEGVSNLEELNEKQQKENNK